MNEEDNKNELYQAQESLDSVADGTFTMSQRKLSTIEKWGGIKGIKKLAEKRNVHLLQVEDDKGIELIAASVKPFKITC